MIVKDVICAFGVRIAAERDLRKSRGVAWCGQSYRQSDQECGGQATGPVRFGNAVAAWGEERKSISMRRQKEACKGGSQGVRLT